MNRRAIVLSTTVSLVVFTSCLFGVSARASTRHAGTFQARGPSIAVQLGRSFAPAHAMLPSRPLLVMPTRPLLVVPMHPAPGSPMQNGARERDEPKSTELVPSAAGNAGAAGSAGSAAPVVSPAAKARARPFPDFANPLHRHRMAMPNAVVPAYGDLSF